MVVIFAEGFDQISGVLEVDKLVFVEALVAELPVEALDVAVLGGFSGRDEAVLDLAVVCPALQRQAGELGSVVGDQAAGPSAQFGHIVQHPCHPRTRQRRVGLDPQTFAGVVVMDGQQAQGAATGQPVVDEVEAPALVGSHRSDWSLHAPHELLFPPASLLHLQAFGPVKPIDPLVIVGHAFPAQQDEQTAIAPAAAHGGMSPQSAPHGQIVPLAVGLVVIAAHSQLQQPASPRPADRVCLL